MEVKKESVQPDEEESVIIGGEEPASTQTQNRVLLPPSSTVENRFFFLAWPAMSSPLSHRTCYMYLVNNTFMLSILLVDRGSGNVERSAVKGETTEWRTATSAGE